MLKSNVKNVLLIGSTGFIGKVTLGLLLERNDVNKVYILIRPKVNTSKKENERESMSTSDAVVDFNAIMTRFKQLKTSPCFQSDECQKAFSDGRVIPVAGDANKENLGLGQDDYERMTSSRLEASDDNSSVATSYVSLLGFRSDPPTDDKRDKVTKQQQSSCRGNYDVKEAVTYIINLAADVSFEKSFPEAMTSNVDTAMNVLAFAKDCKYLANFVHCSTAYVTSHGKERDVNGIKEELHSIPSLFNAYGDAEAIYNGIKSGIIKSKEKDLLPAAGHNNSYTFTKYLAEILLAQKCKGCIPLAIVRPSIVSVSLRYPAPGWTDSHNALDGFIQLYGAGFIHTNTGDNETLYDVVPCDYVADRLIHAAFETCSISNEKKARVIHVTAGKKNNIENPGVFSVMEDFWNPRNREKVILRPFLRQKSDNLNVGKSIQKDARRLQRIMRFLLVIGRRRLAKKLEKIIPLLQKVNEVFVPFNYYRYDFQSEYSIQDFEPNFNWKDYTHLICQGIHYYLLRRGKQSPNNPKPKYRLSNVH